MRDSTVPASVLSKEGIFSESVDEDATRKQGKGEVLEDTLEYSFG